MDVFNQIMWDTHSGKMFSMNTVLFPKAPRIVVVVINPFDITYFTQFILQKELNFILQVSIIVKSSMHGLIPPIFFVDFTSFWPCCPETFQKCDIKLSIALLPCLRKVKPWIAFCHVKLCVLAMGAWASSMLSDMYNFSAVVLSSRQFIPE